MPRSRRSGVRLLFALLLLAAAGYGTLAWISRGPVRDLIPGGAVLVAELRDAADTYRRLEDSAFARRFAGSSTWAWLERTDFVKTLDGLIAEAKKVSGLPIQRRHLLDLCGREAVVAFYPISGAEGPLPHWVAGCRLSLRAWGIATVLSLADRLGVGHAPVRRESVAGKEIFCFASASPGTQYHAFTVGRLLVVGIDRELVVQAARCAAGDGTPVTRDPAWAAVRSQLPPGGLFLWAGAAAVPAALIPPAKAGLRSAGLVVLPGRETEIRLFTAPGEDRPAALSNATAVASLPGIAMLARDPLFLYSRRGASPPLVGEWLENRAQAVARRDGAAVGAFPPLGEGFGLVLTEGAGNGPLPQPRGLVIVGMPDPAAAATALRLLYPRGSRSGDVGGLEVISTRESLPLLEPFELWGAAAENQLVFATDSGLMVGLRPGSGGERAAATMPDPAAALGDGWRVEAVAAVSMEKALPLLRRYALPLSGLLRARSENVPDLPRDLELLGAIRAVTVYTGSRPEGSLTRVRITIAGG